MNRLQFLILLISVVLSSFTGSGLIAWAVSPRSVQASNHVSVFEADTLRCKIVEVVTPEGYTSISSKGMTIFSIESRSAVLSVLNNDERGNLNMYSNHKLVFTAGADLGGHGALEINNRRGKSTILIGSTKSGDGTIGICDKYGEKVIQCATTKSGFPAISLRSQGMFNALGIDKEGGTHMMSNKMGRKAVVIASDPLGNGMIGVFDRHDKINILK